MNLLAFLMRSVVVTGIGLALLAVFRNKSNAVRHAICVGSLLSILVIGAVGLLPISEGIPGPRTTIPAPSIPRQWEQPEPHSDSLSFLIHAPSPTSTKSAQPVLLIFYRVIALALILRILSSMVLLAIKVHRSPVLPSDSEFTVRRLSEGTVPMTAWVLQHVILVPDAWEQWSAERQAIVLCHERAHIRRGDWFWQVGGMIAAAVAWPNPFAWILLRQSRDLAEQAVDDIVVESGISPATYANDLLCIARDSQSARIAAALPMANQPVARRIKMILANRPQRGIVTTSVLFGTAIGFSMLIAGASGWKLTQGKAEDATPEAALKSFVDALDRKDPESALKKVMNAKVTPELQKIFSMFKEFPGITLISASSTQQGDQAKVTCEWLFTPEPERKFHDVLQLTRIEGAWKLVVPNHLPSDQSISAVVYLFGNPKGIPDSKASAEKLSCLSNIKLIGLAAIQFLSDNNDVFAFNKSPYQTVLAKYLRSEKILHCPLDPPNTMSYSFNSALLGKSLDKVLAPASTIMFYEGSNGRLNFHHDGKAMVVFADGHAKGVSANGVKFCTWDPSKRPIQETDLPSSAARVVHP